VIETSKGENKMKVGKRVRLVNTARRGTVLRVVKADGIGSDAVLVEWEERQIDARWNWYGSSWERSIDLV
jgi:hypothetical protein